MNEVSVMNTHTFAVCAYKQSPYLEACIQSLCEQTLKSHIVIATSTPNDFIYGVARKYHLEVFTHPDGGIANDWNFALHCADSEYCTLAHQDDVYLPEYLEGCITKMDKRKNPLIAFTDYQEIIDQKRMPVNLNLKIKETLLFPLRHFDDSRFVRRRVLSFGSPICCPSVTYHMKALRNFRFDPSMSVSLDWDAWERISALDGSFCYVAKPLMLHRIHELSETTNAIQDNRRSREDLRMLRRFWNRTFAQLIFRFYSRSQDSNHRG